MKTPRRISIIVVTAAFLAASPIAYFAWAGTADAPPQNAAAAPDFPSEATYPHVVRFKIKDVAPLERVDDTQLLKLTVERHYGKIEAASLNRAKKHETQELTIIFPAAPDADIRVGDIIDYRLARYVQINRE